MKSGIYQILNTVNGKRYIGSAVNFKERWSLHLRQLKNDKHHSIALQRAWNKYGESSFKFEILLTCEKEELLEYEQLHFDEFKPEYNICKFAGNMLGFKFNEMSIAKMSKAAKGHKRWLNRKHTEESRDKMSKAAKANPTSYWKDKPLLEEHKNKIAKAHTGKTNSEETRLKISKSNTGQKRSEEARANMSKAQKNHPVSDETKRKIGETQKGRTHSKETCEKRSESMKRTLLIRNIIRNWGCAL